MKIALLLLSATTVALASGSAFSELARHVNSLKTTWTATEQPAAIFQSGKKMTLGALSDDAGLSHKVFSSGSASLPESFDARQNWSYCATMNQIRDQGHCGSCWAHGVTEAMTDRLCVYRGRNDPSMRNLPLSVQDLNSCCGSTCGNCSAGWPAVAWQHIRDVGLVTNSCAPYTPCSASGWPYPPCPAGDPTPPCPANCSDGTSMSAAPRYKAYSAYLLDGEENFMQELIDNGPFSVSFNVYNDFFTYRTGVYQHVTGSLEGRHCVKLLGWGVDNATKYWTIANSWNTDWGEGGFFRMLRGTNECGIEAKGTAGAAAKDKS